MEPTKNHQEIAYPVRTPQGNASMAKAGEMKSLLKLFGGSIAPLALSSGYHHPMLTLCGAACGTSLLFQSM